MSQACCKRQRCTSEQQEEAKDLTSKEKTECTSTSAPVESTQSCLVDELNLTMKDKKHTSANLQWQDMLLMMQCCARMGSTGCHFDCIAEENIDRCHKAGLTVHHCGPKSEKCKCGGGDNSVCSCGSCTMNLRVCWA